VEDDAAAFLREMAGVRPIRGNEPPRVSPAAPEPASRAPQTDEAEVLAELSDLVAGQLGFDISQTTEYLQGHVVGLDPRLIRRLRDGELAFQAHLDLHGHTAAEARVALDRFLADAIGRGLRCVLVVHGRGLNSENRSPVLKKSVSTWLSQGTWARWVLAFTSARPCDGGLGALYVLLRRKREGKRPIRVLEGAGP
jgi:DNA-nicking Smr family endonuclease